MIFQQELILPEYKRGFHLITSLIIKALPNLPETGLLHVFIKHTSAGLTLNENADYTVREDFTSFFNKIDNLFNSFFIEINKIDNISK